MLARCNAAVSLVAASNWATFCGSVDGCEPRQALVAHRRQREAADRLDDAIELERPQNAWLHSGNGDCNRQGERRGIPDS